MGGFSIKRLFLMLMAFVVGFILFYVRLLKSFRAVDYSVGDLAVRTASYYPRLYTPFDYTINHPTLCSIDPMTVLIMVSSSPENFDARATIRQTWGSITHRSDIRLTFLLGAVLDPEVQRRIADEDTIFGDLLQETFLDTYRNLTLKSIMMLRWVSENCDPPPKYVLKIDDDCFLNPKKLVTFVETHNDSDSMLIYGHRFTNRGPIRDPHDKRFLTVAEYPNAEFPVYVCGSAAYLITGAAIAPLYEAALNTAMLSLEDVFVSGLCATRAGVNRVDAWEFNRDRPLSVCTAGLSMTFHEVDTNTVHLLWYLTNDKRLEKACNGGVLSNEHTNAVLNRMLLEMDYPGDHH